MINLEKIKSKKCQPPLPLFKKTCPCTIVPPLFLFFIFFPSKGGNQNLLPPPHYASKYLQIYINIYLIMCQIKKKEENNLSTIKTYQMPNKQEYLTCIKVSFSNQNLQNDIVTHRLQYVNDSCMIIHNYKTHLDYFYL